MKVEPSPLNINGFSLEEHVTYIPELYVAVLSENDIELGARIEYNKKSYIVDEVTKSGNHYNIHAKAATEVRAVDL